jgi:hypothetical protein
MNNAFQLADRDMMREVIDLTFYIDRKKSMKGTEISMPARIFGSAEFNGPVVPVHRKFTQLCHSELNALPPLEQ